MVGARFFRFSIALFFTGSFYTAYAQSVDIGLRGSLSAAYLINPNFGSNGSDASYRFTVSDNYGLNAAIIFKHGYALEIDILGSTVRQGYRGTFSSAGILPGLGLPYQAGESYTSLAKVNITQIPILLRSEYKGGNYWEIGFGYEIVSSASYSATYSNPDFGVTYNTTNAYAKNNFLLIAGLGKDWRLSKTSFYLNTGFRLSYSVMDMEGVDGHGQSIYGPYSLPLYQPNHPPSYYDGYHGTHSIDFSFNAGIFYRIPVSNVHHRQLEF